MKNEVLTKHLGQPGQQEKAADRIRRCDCVSRRFFKEIACDSEIISKSFRLLSRLTLFLLYLENTYNLSYRAKLPSSFIFNRHEQPGNSQSEASNNQQDPEYSKQSYGKTFFPPSLIYSSASSSELPIRSL